MGGVGAINHWLSRQGAVKDGNRAREDPVVHALAGRAGELPRALGDWAACIRGASTWIFGDVRSGPTMMQGREKALDL